MYLYDFWLKNLYSGRYSDGRPVYGVNILNYLICKNEFGIDLLRPDDATIRRTMYRLKLIATALLPENKWGFEIDRGRRVRAYTVKNLVQEINGIFFDFTTREGALSISTARVAAYEAPYNFSGKREDLPTMKELEALYVKRGISQRFWVVVSGSVQHERV